jgi:hypothetical protein
MTWTRNVSTGAESGDKSDGEMTIIGSGELTQSQVNTAIDRFGTGVALTNVVVAGDFTSLGNNAFISTGFTSILFPSNSLVTSFSGTASGTGTFRSMSKLTTLVLPPKLTIVSYGMVAYCELLETLVIPSTVKTILSFVFNSCTKLHTVDFASGMTLSSLNYLFHNATGLRALKVGNSTEWNFMQNSNSFSLQSGVIVSYYSEPNVYRTWNGSSLTTNTGSGLVYQNNVLTGSYTGKLKIIGALSRSAINAVITSSTSFFGLEVVLEGGTYTSLEDGIFSGLKGLTKVQFPAGRIVNTIGARSFQGCSSLVNLVIPSGVTTIGAQSFQGCSSLIDLVIPSGVTTIGAQSFQGCSALGGNLVLPSGITTIENETFQGAASLLSVDLVQTTTLGNSVFKGCTLLKDVIIPVGLTSMGNNTFEDCTSLENLVFPYGLVTIGGTETLAGATAIRSLKIHELVWETAIKPSFVDNLSGIIQLVQFYGDPDILETLETQRDLWNVTEVDGSNTKGYQKVLDYYATADTYSVDRSGGTTTLVKSASTGVVTYDVDTSSLTGIGIYGGILTIVGSGELTQAFIDAGILAHTNAQNGITLTPLHTLVVGANFTSLESSLSLESTGIKKLRFPAESPITKTGVYTLSINGSGSVVLPKWVTQTGPWSL